MQFSLGFTLILPMTPSLGHAEPHMGQVQCGTLGHAIPCWKPESVLAPSMLLHAKNSSMAHVKPMHGCVASVCPGCTDQLLSLSGVHIVDKWQLKSAANSDTVLSCVSFHTMHVQYKYVIMRDSLISLSSKLTLIVSEDYTDPQSVYSGHQPSSSPFTWISAHTRAHAHTPTACTLPLHDQGVTAPGSPNNQPTNPFSSLCPASYTAPAFQRAVGGRGQ